MNRQESQRIVRRSFGEMRIYAPSIVGVFIISIAAIPLTLVTPLPIKIIVDSVLGSQPLPDYLQRVVPSSLRLSGVSLILLAIGILLATTVLVYVQNLLNIWSTNKVRNRITLDMRARLFRQMQRLSIAYHDTKGATDSTYRVQYDAPAVSSFAIDALIPLITALLLVAGMLIATLYLDWELALVAILVSPVLLLLTLFYRRRIRLEWRKVKASESRAMSVVQESLSAARVVKAFGQEERESEQFVSHSNESQSAALRAYVEGGVYNLLGGIVTGVGLAAVLYVGILHVQAGALSLGGLLVVNYYLTQLYSPLKTMGQKVLDMQLSLAGLERFFAILDERDDVVESLNPKPLRRARGKVAFEGVTFEYEKGHPVLQNVSLLLPPGKTVGLVGPTGSGKTTLSSLLLRFFDPTGGKILLDDVDLRDYRVADLRNQFAVVLQETLLFSTSIAENIRFARPEASFSEVVDAAKAANAHEFIMGLPDGYDTQVGERGMRLSGGERQRISLARAFLKDAPLLILDEPTSSLDTKTEAGILDAMQRLSEGRTTLMIAHRGSALRNCDIIVKLDGGMVSGVSTEIASVIQSMSAYGAGDAGRVELQDGVAG